MFSRRPGRGIGRSGGVGSTPLPSAIGDNSLRSQTDVETATQATGKTLTLATPGFPQYLITTATGTTGRFQVALPNGETIEFECVPNAPPQVYPIPDVFKTFTTKFTFSVITVDAAGTITAKVLYRPGGG